jgi:hypothetical protein
MQLIAVKVRPKLTPTHPTHHQLPLPSHPHDTEECCSVGRRDLPTPSGSLPVRVLLVLRVQVHVRVWVLESLKGHYQSE